MLARKGYAEVTASGAYDHATMKAVQSMQHLHGLTPNGKVDLSTWCAVVGGSVREAFGRCGQALGPPARRVVGRADLYRLSARGGRRPWCGCGRRWR
jgi:hypothetical protein